MSTNTLPIGSSVPKWDTRDLTNGKRGFGLNILKTATL